MVVPVQCRRSVEKTKKKPRKGVVPVCKLRCGRGGLVRRVVKGGGSCSFAFFVVLLSCFLRRLPALARSDLSRESHFRPRGREGGRYAVLNGKKSSQSLGDGTFPAVCV